MNENRKPYRVNGKDIVVKSENALYNNNEMTNVTDAEAALDNLHGRLKAVEHNGGISGSSPLKDKTFAFIGDSFSSPGRWQTNMCNALGAILSKNVAHDGAQWTRTIYNGDLVNSAFHQAKQLRTYYDSQPADPDYILVCLGTNDAANLNNNSVGDIDYGKCYVYTRNIGDTTSYEDVLNGSTGDGRGWLNGSNEIIPGPDGKPIFWKYARSTSWISGSTVEMPCGRTVMIDPSSYILDADCDFSATFGTFPVSDKLDLRCVTGGIQATLLYLKFHFPNSIIKIGFTPAGLVHSGPRKNTNNNTLNWRNVNEMLKTLAELYGVGYLETLKCGISPLAESDAPFHGSHPTESGYKRIGQYMARLLLSNL